MIFSQSMTNRFLSISLLRELVNALYYGIVSILWREFLGSSVETFYLIWLLHIVFSTFFEIPAGIFCDKYGYKKGAVYSGLFMGLGFVFYVSCFFLKDARLLALILAELLCAIGACLFSGNLDAWFVNHQKRLGQGYAKTLKDLYFYTSVVWLLVIPGVLALHNYVSQKPLMLSVLVLCVLCSLLIMFLSTKWVTSQSEKELKELASLGGVKIWKEASLEIFRSFDFFAIIAVGVLMVNLYLVSWYWWIPETPVFWGESFLKQNYWAVFPSFFVLNVIAAWVCRRFFAIDASFSKNFDWAVGAYGVLGLLYMLIFFLPSNFASVGSIMVICLSRLPRSAAIMFSGIVSNQLILNDKVRATALSVKEFFPGVLLFLIFVLVNFVFDKHKDVRPVFLMGGVLLVGLVVSAILRKKTFQKMQNT